MIEFLAAIPSIAYGLWGLFVVVPFLGNIEPSINRFFASVPGLHVLHSEGFPTGRDMLAAGLILAIMILPIITAIGRDVLPKVTSGQFQVRLRAPDGTRIERTEQKLIKAIDILKELVGKENIGITSAFIGQHAPLFSISPIYLFTNGPHEAVLQVSLNDKFHGNLDQLKDSFRKKMKESMPDVKLSFEPIELTDKILSQGSPTPIEVRIAGRNKKLNEEFARKIVGKLSQINYLRDVQIAQSIQYPALK